MAISRDIMNRRSVPGQGTGPVGMNEPTFRMEMPRLASVLDRMSPMPDRGQLPMPRPMPMPSPDRRFDFRRDMPPPTPMPSPMPPPGMGPFRQMPFPDRMPRRQRMPDLMDMNPRQEGFQMFAMPAAATIDPSDYRTIIKMIEQGLDPEDYMNRGGIASLLK